MHYSNLAIDIRYALSLNSDIAIDFEYILRRFCYNEKEELNCFYFFLNTFSFYKTIL